MALRDFTFEVGYRKVASDAELRYQSYGMEIEIKGVDPDDIVNLLTDDEIANQVNLTDMLKALISRHSLTEVVSELIEIPGVEVSEVMDTIYNYADDEVRDWVTDHLGDNE